MFKRKLYMQITSREQKLIVRSLIDLKNELTRQGRYTDPVDELLIKVLNV